MKFFKLMFKLALPIILQHFLTSSMALIDTLMIGQLNETAIAAVGIANQSFFIFIIIQFGVHSGISIFTAQYWGKQDLKNIKRLVGLGLTMGLFFCSFFVIIAVFIPSHFLSLFSKDPEVVSLGVGYLRIIGYGFVMSMISISFMSNLRSIEIVKAPMYVSLVAVSLNIILNYLLIFGNWGFPELGVNGAAIATTTARFVEAFLLVGIIYYKRYPIAATLKEMLDFDFPFFKRIMTTCWPVILNEFFWVTGASLYSLVYARIGTESIAAVNIVSSVENFMLVPFFGMFHAGAIMIGNSIGARKEDEAYQFGKYLLISQLFLAIFTGSLMILLRTPILSFYNISDAAYTNAYHLMMVAGMVLFAKVTNFTIIVAVLRGGGDTRYGFLLDLTGVWCIGVPMAFIGAFYFNLPVYWVMPLVAIEEIYKFILGIRRFLSKKWIMNLVAAR
jgi:putative MATE family efflux protein